MYASPETIGPYRVFERVGAGGMGVVYRAVHDVTGEPAAVKTVRVAQAGLLAGIRREIHALGRARHPGVVRVLDEGLDRGFPYYAMELVDGPSLRTLYANAGPPGEPGNRRPLLLSVLRRVCSALAYLHGEGIVHCDLKPDNVLVRRDGTPVLVDFGLAARVAGDVSREALDVREEGSGTVIYMSPEQVQGHIVDARADLYALGCMLYEALTGRPPFVRKRPVEVAWAHVESPPEPPSAVAPDVAPELESLVLRLLAKPPSERFGYASDVGAELEALGAGPGLDGPPPRSYLYRAAVAGRDAALARMRSMLKRLDAAGGVVLVGGESGIGKTRFVVEVGRIARDLGMRILTAEAEFRDEPRGAAPLSSLRAVLEALVDRCAELGPIETERLFGPRAVVLAAYEPRVATLPGVRSDAELDALGADAARRRLFSALEDTLAALAEGARPVVLVLDDVHWADDLTLGFLEHAAASGRLLDARVLVVATYRTEEACDTVRRMLASDACAHLDLERLDADAVSSIVGDMLALSPPPNTLSRYLARQSEGNPFFVAEYLLAAVESGVLRREGAGGWEVSDRGPKDSAHDVLPLPGTVRELVQRRLADLGGAAAAAARAAAAIGGEFDADVLARVAGLGEHEAMEAIADLLRRHVLVEPRAGMLRFAHDKLREVAYASIGAEARVAMHRATACALEDSATPDRAALGHHWERAGDIARARMAYLAGARGARDRFAHAEAERLYRSHLFLSERGEESVVARSELAYDVLRVRGLAEHAITELRSAADEAAELGLRAAEAEAWRRAGCVLWEVARMDEAHAAFAHALELGGGDRRFEGVTLGNLANVFLQQGRLDEALALYERSLAVHRETGDRYGEAVRIGSVGIVHYDRGEYDRARTYMEEAVAILREIGHRPMEAKMLGNLALVNCDSGNHQDARALYERALEIAREVGDRREEGILNGNFAVNCMRRARYHDALMLGRAALAIHAETGNRRSSAITLGSLAGLERQTGRYDDAERSLDRAEAILREVGDRMYVGITLLERASLALARGRSGAAHLAEALALADELGLGPESELRRTAAMVARAEASFQDGEALVRGERVEEIAPWFRRYLVEEGMISEAEGPGTSWDR